MSHSQNKGVPSSTDLATFFVEVYGAAKTAITNVVQLTDDHLLAGRTNGSNKVYVSIEKLNSQSPGVKLEFKMGSDQVVVGRFDPSTERFIDRKRVRMDQGILNYTVAQRLAGIAI